MHPGTGDGVGDELGAGGVKINPSKILSNIFASLTASALHEKRKSRGAF